MHKKPVVSLEDINSQEREQLSAVTKKQLMNGILTNLVPFVLCALAAVYINLKWLSWKMDNENLRAFLNFALVIGSLLPARMFVNKVLQHNKAMSAWKKKVFRGEISGKEGNTVFISNQKIKLPADMAASFQTGDVVEIGVSTVNDLVIYATKQQ
ncbi:MAG: hypothetical protein L6Q81_16380 [Bacteroidia bacterium]|nr:hypothetical protein [Bacteroidia bacterium]